MMASGSVRAFDQSVLVCVCRHPYATKAVLAVLIKSPNSRVTKSLQRLTKARLVGRISYKSRYLPRSYVYYPQPEGIQAAADKLGQTVEDLMRTSPASYERLRWIVQRIDSVTDLYLLAATVATAEAERCDEEEEAVEGRVTVSLYRTGAYDAIISLPDNRNIGVIRQGLARSRSLLNERLHYLAPPARKEADDQNDRDPPYETGKVLVLTNTEWQARVVHSDQNGRWMGPTLHVEPEDPRTLGDPDYVAWELVRDLRPSDEAPPSMVPETAGSHFPTRNQLERLSENLVFKLSIRQKFVLDTLVDLAMIPHDDLAVFLGRDDSDRLSSGRMSDIMNELVHEHGLVRKIGGRGTTLYALDTTGIAYTRDRDRITSTDANNLLSLELIRETDASVVTGGVQTYRYRGSVPYRWSRETEHTRGVYWLLSRLRRGVVALSPFMEFEWFLPMHRTRRDWEDGGIEPDAIVECLYRTPEGRTVRVPIMVEYERRDIHPGRSSRRLKRYAQYFGSGQALTDHGAAPLLLVVFDNERGERQFLQAATKIEADLPLFTANMKLLSQVPASKFTIANAWWPYPLYIGRRRRQSLVGRIHTMRH